MDNTFIFNEKIHKLGIITSLIVWLFFIAIPLGITILFQVNLNYLQLLSIAGPISITFGIVGLAEKLSIAPIIGPGAMYLASSTGNVQNMKLPAAINAMRVMDCEEGSEEGRVVSIIAVATSSFVTTFIVFLGMLFLAPIIAPLLTNPLITPAFDNMLPALLGPLVLPLVLKNPKAASVPFSIAVLFSLALGGRYIMLQSFIMIIVITLSLIVFKYITDKQKYKLSDTRGKP